MFIEVGGLATHVEVEGPQHGEAVLLLHSLGTNLHVWDPQAAALARTHRVIRPDLRGHGLTEAPGGRVSSTWRAMLYAACHWRSCCAPLASTSSMS